MKFKQFVKDSIIKIGAVFKRFPVATILLAILTICLIAEVDLALWAKYFLTVGATLALSMDNWRESCQRKKLAIGVTAGVYFVHVVITVILCVLGDIDSRQLNLALVSISTMAFLSLFCLLFLRQKKDVPFWHFGFNLGKAAGISFIFTLTLFGGLLLILFAFDELFDLHIDGEIYLKISIFSGVFALPVIFMAFIPSGENKMIESLPSGKSLGDKLVHFVIMPLFGVYLFVMYLFIISSVVHSELPDETVPFMVAAMVAALFIVIRVYPARESEENAFERKLLKWLPVVMLPLLIMMSIGIINDILDDGLRIENAYMILFNIWCYAICIYLFITHSRRIVWIPVSFGLAFCIVSVLPFNVCKGVELYLHHQIKSQITASGTYHLPLSSDDYKSWMKSLDEQTSNKMYTRLSYMEDEFNRESIDDLLSEEVAIWSYDDEDEPATDDDKPKTVDDEPKTVDDEPKTIEDPVPENFKNVRIRMSHGKTYNSPISCNRMMVLAEWSIYNRAKLNVKTGAITFEIIAEEDKYTFEIDRNLIDYGEKNEQQTGYLILRGEQADLYISKFIYNYYRSGDKDVSGSDESGLSLSGLLCIH